MPTSDSFHWEKAVLGESCEYPGHPLVLSCMVMDRYADLATACSRESGCEFYNALTDSFIPGAGCAVHAALDMLRAAQTHGLPEAYALADRYWQGWEQQNADNGPSAERGRAQALRLQSRFEEKLKTWGTPSDPGSPYRLEANVVSAGSAR